MSNLSFLASLSPTNHRVLQETKHEPLLTSVIGVASVRAPTLTKLSDRRDITRTIAPTFIWSCAELTASNVVITLPAVSKFLHAGFSKVSDRVLAWKKRADKTVIGTRIIAPIQRKLQGKALPHRLDTMASFDSLGPITLTTAVNSVNTGADEKWR